MPYTFAFLKREHFYQFPGRVHLMNVGKKTKVDDNDK